MYTTESAWWGFTIGCVFTGGSIFGLFVVGEGFEWRGAYIPLWVDWLLLPCGIALLTLSIRALLRGRGAPELYDDEDAARAEAEMDAMYLREHGELPEKPRKDT